jgi:hypothetical protein
MPASYLVDREGMIRHEFVGFRAGHAEQIRAQVEALVTPGSQEPAHPGHDAGLR